MFKQEPSLFESDSDEEAAAYLNAKADNEFELKLPEPYYSDDEDAHRSFQSDAADFTYANQWYLLVPGVCVGETFPDNSQDYYTASSGPKPTALAAIQQSEESALCAFQLLFNDHMVDTIINYTQMAANKTARYADWEFSRGDFYLYLAVLLGKASCDARHLTISEMFSFKWGPPFLAKCMSKTTFEIINRFLRFDDKNTRSERLKTDNEAIISEVWDRFNLTCQEAFEAGPNIAIDMQLAPCEARCPFIQSAPDLDGMQKTGLMYFLIADLDHGYILSSRPYFHQVRPKHFTGLQTFAKNMLEPFLHNRRTVTASKLFTSIDLADYLRSNNTLFVGAYREDHSDMPQHLYKDYLRQCASEFFCLAERFSLTRYQPKTRSHPIVSILSTQHPNNVLVSKLKKKVPSSLGFYEKRHKAIKHLIEKPRSCSSCFMTPQWKIYPFCNLLDLAVVNAQVLYQAATNVKKYRRDFLQQLAEELAELGVLSKSTINIKNEIHLDGLDGLDAFENDDNSGVKVTEGAQLKIRARCMVRATDACKLNKTMTICGFCNQHACTSCISAVQGVCQLCYNKYPPDSEVTTNTDGVLQVKAIKGKRMRCRVRATDACKQYKTAHLCGFCLKYTCSTCMSVIQGVCQRCWDIRRFDSAVSANTDAGIAELKVTKGIRQRCKVRATSACKQYKTVTLCAYCEKHTCTTCMSELIGICQPCWDERCRDRGS